MKDVAGQRVKIIATVAASWQNVALVGLKLPHYVVTNIEHSTFCYAEDRCREAFRRWLDGEGGCSVSWEALFEALRDADHSELASRVEKGLLCKH